MPIQRMTRPTIAVLEALLDRPGRRWYGLQLCRATGLPSGTLYPILARLEEEGWAASEWEDPRLHEDEGRARRRYYWITGTGVARATELIEWRRRTKPLLRPGDEPA